MATCNSYTYSDTCGTVLSATCVEVEQTFPGISSISGTCSDLDTVISDLYNLVDDTYIDMSVYNKGCLDFSPTADADITPIQVFNKLTSELCTLKSTVDSIDTVDINNLDFSCLGPTDTCGDPLAVNNLEDLLQLIIDKLCSLNPA